MARRRIPEHRPLGAKRAEQIHDSRLQKTGGLGHRRCLLPQQATRLVGRTVELGELHTRLQDNDTRLLTLTGPGGTGKTRLALALADEAVGAFREGACFVDLTPLRDPDLVLPAIARALGIAAEVGHPLEPQVVTYLTGQKLLLVLDNFEQVLPAGALLARLLASTPDVKMLVTSREPLRVSWERTFSVRPLAVPDMLRPTPSDALASVPAVALFVQRTQAVVPEFRLSEQNARTVAELCAKLDGLPLAIELAAARGGALPVEDILARVSHRLTFLTGGAREQPARHRTLRAAIDWSYDLLTGSERMLFRQLGILVGDWSLTAAAAVVDAPGAPTGESDAAQVLLDGVASLVDKNLIRAAAPVNGEARFSMLETIREYAFDRLQASGERARLERRRAAFLAARSETFQVQFFTPQQQAWLDGHERDLGNIRAALEWTLSEAGDTALGLRLAAALWAFWYLRGYETEGREWLSKLLDAPGMPGIAAEVRAHALFAIGFLASLQADYAAARKLLADGLALERDAGNDTGVALCLTAMARLHRDLGNAGLSRSCAEEGLHFAHAGGQRGVVGMVTNVLADACFVQGDLATARALYEEGLALWRELGAQQGIGYSLGGLGEVQRVDGRPTAARALYEETLRVRRALGDRPNIAIVLGQLGLVALDLGDLAEARGLFVESLLLSRDLGARRGIALALEGLAVVAVTEGRGERAVRLAGAADAVRTATGTQSPPKWQADLARRLGSARHALGRDGWAVAWLSGQALTLERAIALALTDIEAHPASDAGRASRGTQLSSREREVARLVGEGLTSRQMAERLTVTERTVNTHLERIRDKLGVRSRAQITAWLLRSPVAVDDPKSAPASSSVPVIER